MQANNLLKEPNFTEKTPIKPLFLNASDLKSMEFEPLFTYKILLKFMQDLTRNHDNLMNEFKGFLEILSKFNGFISIEEFSVFIENLRLNLSEKEITIIVKFFDFDDKKKIQGSDFNDSYKAFRLLEEKLQRKFYDIYQAFELILSMNNTNLDILEKELNKISDFGYIQKKSLENFLVNQLKTPRELFKKFDYFNKFEELVLISGFIEKFQLIKCRKSMIHLLEIEVFGKEIIDENIMVFFGKNTIQRKKFYDILVKKKEISQSDDTVNIKEIIMIFQEFKLELAFIEVFFVIKTLNSRLKEKNIIVYEHKIQILSFCEFFIEKIEELKENVKYSPIKNKIEDFDEINDLNALLNEKKNNEKEEDLENLPEKNKDFIKEKTKMEENKDKFEENTEENAENTEKILLKTDEKLKNEKNFEKSPIFTSFQHELKFKCYWLENLDLSKDFFGKSFTLRYY